MCKRYRRPWQNHWHMAPNMSDSHFSPCKVDGIHWIIFWVKMSNIRCWQMYNLHIFEQFQALCSRLLFHSIPILHFSRETPHRETDFWCSIYNCNSLPLHAIHDIGTNCLLMVDLFWQDELTKNINRICLHLIMMKFLLLNFSQNTNNFILTWKMV